MWKSPARRPRRSDKRFWRVVGGFRSFSFRAGCLKASPCFHCPRLCALLWMPLAQRRRRAKYPSVPSLRSATLSSLCRPMPHVGSAIRPRTRKCWRYVSPHKHSAAIGWKNATFGLRWSHARCAQARSPMRASGESIMARPIRRAGRWNMARVFSRSQPAITGLSFMPISVQRSRQGCCGSFSHSGDERSRCGKARRPGAQDGGSPLCHSRTAAGDQLR